MNKILLLIIIFFSSSSIAQAPMEVVYFNNYPPFSWEENGQMKGILIDTLTEVIKNRMGLEISHQGYPWARAQLIVKANEADAFVTVPTPERKIYTEVSSEPVIIVTFTPFTSIQNTRIDALKAVKNLSDLKKFSHIQYIGSGWAKHKLGGMNVEWVRTLDKALFLLAKNRFDLFVDTSPVVRFNVKRLGYQEQVVELPNIIDTSSFNLCISKKSRYVDVLPAFDAEMAKLRASGKLQEIYDQYR